MKTLRRAFRRIPPSIALALAGLAAVLWADLGTPAPSLSSDFHPLFQSAADYLGVPISLTQAIAEVESGTFSHVLNIEGQSLFFDTKEDALTAARRALAAGKSFDSGIMQINSQWIKRFDLPLEAVFDPAANIYLGSWILGENIRQYPGWRAVARYHSPNESRGQTYVERVKAVLKAKKTGVKAKALSKKLTAGSADGFAGGLDESKEKITSNGLAAGNAFVREPAHQLVVYRAAREASKRESAVSAVKRDKAPSAFVQRFGEKRLVFARQASDE